MKPPIPTDPLPLPDECRQGENPRLGYPTNWETEGACGALNIAAARRGSRDAWRIVRQPAEGVFVVTDAVNVGISVAGRVVSFTDAPHVMAALKEAPLRPDQRHASWADSARRRAGEHAMRVQDSMVRARLLDAIDGWSAVLGEPIEETGEGGLYEPLGLDFRCRLLKVTCPSTRRAYVLRVPRECATVHEARLWVMHGLEPEVET